MVFAFLMVWAIGAALLLACIALVWSERITVLRTVPACAACGYHLTGLSRGSRCPECGETGRKFVVGSIRPGTAEASLLLWTAPALLGLGAAWAMAAATRVHSPMNAVCVAENGAAFLGVGLMLRAMLRWVTLSAAKMMMWCATAAMIAALGAAVLDAAVSHDMAATPEEILRIGPLVTIPFAGFGFAGGIVLLHWWRSRPARAAY